MISRPTAPEHRTQKLSRLVMLASRPLHILRHHSIVSSLSKLVFFNTLSMGDV